MTFLRQSTLRVASVALTWLYTLYRAHPAVWRVMARNYRPWMGRFVRLHAWMTCQFAWTGSTCTAADGASAGSAPGLLPADGQAELRAGLPRGAALPRRGAEIAGSVVDESSGSSGQPFNGGTSSWGSVRSWRAA
jgi:phenylacetate-CoA ligase